MAGFDSVAFWNFLVDSDVATLACNRHSKAGACVIIETEKRDGQHYVKFVLRSRMRSD